MPDRTNPEIPDEEFEQRWNEIAADLSDLETLDPEGSGATSRSSVSKIADERRFTARSSLLSPDPEPLEDTPSSRDSSFDDDARGVRSSSGPASSGPRDWTPAEESDEGSGAASFLDFPDAVGILGSGAEEPPASSPYFRVLWIVAVVAIIASIVMAFGWLPGGGFLAGALGFAGFGCGAFAAFASAPRQEDVDPFDDGARV
ncbi:MAG: hypothetical protein QM705_03645 [Ancrocorticia sp.]